MADDHLDVGAIAKVRRQLFREEDRAMLTACTPERDHKIGEAAAAVCRYCRVNECSDVFEVAMNRALLIQVVDHGSVSACELFEAFFAAGIGKAARVEDEAAAVAGFIDGRLVVDGRAVAAGDVVHLRPIARVDGAD